MEEGLIPFFRFETIFHHHKKELHSGKLTVVSNGKRKQRHLKQNLRKRFLEYLITQLQIQLNLIYPTLRIVYWSALLSEKGGKEQVMHTDFEDNITWPRFAGIVCLDGMPKPMCFPILVQVTTHQLTQWLDMCAFIDIISSFQRSIGFSKPAKNPWTTIIGSPTGMAKVTIKNNSLMHLYFDLHPRTHVI